MEDIQRAVSHRTWPLPSSPWVMFQSWRNLLFAHWYMAPEQVRAAVPPPFELDLHDGRAFVAITPFLLTDLRARGLPPLPGLSEFPELNCRTYVRLGDKPGIWFFSLDAGSTAAVAGARAFYRLPYHRADMRIDFEGGWIRYHSRRRGSDAEFVGRYRPAGDAFEPAPGTLEYFLTERYALYAVLRSGKALRAEIHHRPWRLQAAEAEIEVNTVARAAGIQLPDAEPLLHFSTRQDTLIWPPEILP